MYSCGHPQYEQCSFLLYCPFPLCQEDFIKGLYFCGHPFQPCSRMLFWYTSALGMKRFRPHLAPMTTYTQTEQATSRAGWKPVSYTHLDVYKRQAMSSLSSLTNALMTAIPEKFSCAKSDRSENACWRFSHVLVCLLYTSNRCWPSRRPAHPHKRPH